MTGEVEAPAAVMYVGSHQAFQQLRAGSFDQPLPLPSATALHQSARNAAAGAEAWGQSYVDGYPQRLGSDLLDSLLEASVVALNGLEMFFPTGYSDDPTYAGDWRNVLQADFRGYPSSSPALAAVTAQASAFQAVMQNGEAAANGHIARLPQFTFDFPSAFNCMGGLPQAVVSSVTTSVAALAPESASDEEMKALQNELAAQQSGPQMANLSQLEEQIHSW
jgi:hypothetical protein